MLTNRRYPPNTPSYVRALDRCLYPDGVMTHSEAKRLVRLVDNYDSAQKQEALAAFSGATTRIPKSPMVRELFERTLAEHLVTLDLAEVIEMDRHGKFRPDAVRSFLAKASLLPLAPFRAHLVSWRDDERMQSAESSASSLWGPPLDPAPTATERIDAWLAKTRIEKIPAGHPTVRNAKVSIGIPKHLRYANATSAYYAWGPDNRFPQTVSARVSLSSDDDGHTRLQIDGKPIALDGRGEFWLEKKFGPSGRRSVCYKGRLSHKSGEMRLAFSVGKEDGYGRLRWMHCADVSLRELGRAQLDDVQRYDNKLQLDLPPSQSRLRLPASLPTGGGTFTARSLRRQTGQSSFDVEIRALGGEKKIVIDDVVIEPEVDNVNGMGKFRFCPANSDANIPFLIDKHGDSVFLRVGSRDGVTDGNLWPLEINLSQINARATLFERLKSEGPKVVDVPVTIEGEVFIPQENDTPYASKGEGSLRLRVEVDGEDDVVVRPLGPGMQNYSGGKLRPDGLFNVGGWGDERITRLYGAADADGEMTVGFRMWEDLPGNVQVHGTAGGTTHVFDSPQASGEAGPLYTDLFWNDLLKNGRREAERRTAPRPPSPRSSLVPTSTRDADMWWRILEAQQSARSTCGHTSTGRAGNRGC